MSLNPVQFGTEVIDQFGRWLLTTFPIADRNLEAQVKEQLRHDVGGERLIAKGPYVYLNRAFEKGPSVSALIGERGLGLHPALSGVFPFDSVHKHQELALRHVKAGKHTVVATGTGSGKTEAFLLPIVDECLHLRDQDSPQGVRAILVYPMNALADDQLRRLRPMLAGTGITFGRYTGNTPQSDAAPQGTLSAMRRYSREEIELLENGQEERVPIPYEECYNRDDILARSPRILISNYSQLEYMLLRDKDLALFRGAPLKFLVFDEVHTYTGALGSEVACLIRRLRTVARKRPNEVVCIGTSATVQDASGRIDTQTATRSFASELFGVPEADVALVQEHYQRPPELTHEAFVPPPPENPRQLLQAILEEARQYQTREEVEEISDRLLALAEALCGRKAPEGSSPGARLFTLLENNRLVRTLSHTLSTPKLLSEALRSLRPLERGSTDPEDLTAELLGYLTLGALARKDGEPLLRPKLHYFVQGFQGLGCSFDEQGTPRLHFDIDGKTGESESMRFPLVLCRSCGQHYVQVRAGEPVLMGGVGVQATRQVGRYEPLEGGEKQVYFTNQLIGQDDSESPGTREAWLCRFCGTLHDAHVGTCRNESCKRTGLVPVVVSEGEMTKCAACGSPAKAHDEIVTRAHSSEVADVTILSQSMLSSMQEEALQKLLVFSDNRQDAAFQAGWMRERSRRFRLRHLLREVLAQDPSRSWSLNKLTAGIVELGIQHGLFATRTHDRDDDEKRVRWFLLQEFASMGQRRSSLESLALAEVWYLGIGPGEAAEFYARWTQKLDVTPVQLENLVRSILDCHRRRGAVSDPLLAHQWVYGDTEVRKGLVQVSDKYYPQALVLDKDKKNAFLRAFWASNGSSGTQEIIRKGIRGGEHLISAVRNEFLQALWDMLVENDVLVPVELTQRRSGRHVPISLPGRPRQINVEYLAVRQPETHWVCDACRRSQSVPLPTSSCPEYRCSGELKETGVDRDNFDVFQYTQTRFVPLKAAEHSAQVPAAERRVIEEQFKRKEGGHYNCLVCTPTLELGVDIGKLEMALMRNVPPTPANYAQRAGRAGRRHRIAVVFTYCRNSNHDRYFFGSPDAMISGEIRVPAFSMRNEPLIRKHVHSAILTALRERAKEPEREALNLAFPPFVHAYFADEIREGQGDPRLRYLEKPRDLTPLGNLCATYRADIVAELQRTFGETWPGVEAREELVGAEALARYVDEFATDLSGHVRRLFRQVESYRNEVTRLNRKAEGEKLLTDEEEELKRHKGAVRALTDRSRQENYALSYLSVDGFLPGYAMARQQVTAQSLDPFMALSRPASVALREYTPANFVYANKNIFRPRRIEFARTGSEGEPDPTGRRRLRYDSQSQRLWDPKNSSLEGGTTSGAEELESLLLTSVELKRHQDINDSEKQRRRIGFEVLGQPLEKHKGGRYGEIAGLTFKFLSKESLRIVNLGVRRSGEPGYSLFPVCSICGETRSPTMTERELETFREVHKKAHGRDTVGDFALHVEFESDTLHIGPFSSKEKAANLFEAVRIGARQLLDMGETELEGFIYTDSTGEQMVAIYDPMPGGSGFLPLVLQYWEVLCDKARHALEHCATDCEKACYSCMKHFRNQQWHDLLDRHAAIALLMELAQPLRLQHGVEPVGAQPVADPKKADSDSEFDFARICAARNFPVPPAQQLRVDLGGGDYTLADWAWPDRKLLVFIDGTSKKLHGNPAQRAKDHLKRQKCRLLGYYVVEITAQELADSTALAYKFEELRLYLDEG